MSAQKDCEFLVKRARELVSDDPCAAKAWLITARTLYPTDFNIQVTPSFFLRCTMVVESKQIGLNMLLIAPVFVHFCHESCFHSMKCISLNATRRGQPRRGDCSMTCELQPCASVYVMHHVPSCTNSC